MSEMPARIMLVEFILDKDKGPIGTVHQFTFEDGRSEEIFTPWVNEKPDTRQSHFLERTPEGDIARPVPTQNRAVPEEWKALIDKFETKRQKVVTIMHSHRL